MMGCLVVGLKGLSLGSGLPAQIRARPHDPREWIHRKAKGELEGYRGNFSLEERRRKKREKRKMEWNGQGGKAGWRR
jgi:hypothetical protein